MQKKRVGTTRECEQAYISAFLSHFKDFTPFIAQYAIYAQTLVHHSTSQIRELNQCLDVDGKRVVLLFFYLQIKTYKSKHKQQQIIQFY